MPLTLAPSLRGRELFSTAGEYSLNSEHFLALPMVLPKGEGWGEGEGRFLMHGSSSVAGVEPDLHVCARLV